LYISQLIFFTPLSQLGAKSCPSVIWLEGLEQEGYSTDMGTEILMLTNQDHNRLCCNFEVPWQLILIKYFVLVSRICMVGAATVEYVGTGYVQRPWCHLILYSVCHCCAEEKALELVDIWAEYFPSYARLRPIQCCGHTAVISTELSGNVSIECNKMWYASLQDRHTRSPGPGDGIGAACYCTSYVQDCDWILHSCDHLTVCGTLEWPPWP
jgi:hypothetical protein